VRREPTLRWPSGVSRKENCQENVSQVRKHVLLTINPELIHATLEAIRYSRQTLRGICAARAKETRRKKEERERGGGAGREGKNALLVNRATSRARIHARTLVRAYARPKIVITRRRDAVASNVFYPRRGHKSHRV